ncbi:MAG TPA: beta (1-6) glucans synthase [Deltaproteobacteria bacterium]|nr:MAG: hypothetical protein A2048_02110 [Deltaproteobacteria bacterium GWA2_45_12]HBF13180.1 beta (1-6) glucans synthase [Deltaproteobacteria bacterium]
MKMFFFKMLAIFCAFSAFVLVFFFLEKPQTIPEPEISPDQRLQCVSYTPFINDEGPWTWGVVIPDKRIEDDLKILSGRFDCVRTYSVGGLEYVPYAAEKLGMKLMLGIWVNANPIDTKREISTAIELAKKYPETIKAIIVGNETLLRKEVPPTLLIEYINEVKAKLPSIPVTYADVWEFWLKYSQLAPHVDFVTIHILPYWEDDPVGIEGAMNHVEKIYKKLQSKFPQNKILIGETGWPSWGRPREAAFASPINQARYVRGFVALAKGKGWDYNLIEAFDQPWKRNNEGAVGGYWGLYNETRLEKGVFEGPVSFINYQKWFLLSALILSMIFILIAFCHFSGTLQLIQIAVWCFAFTTSFLYQLYDNHLILRNGMEYFWATLLFILSSLCFFAGVPLLLKKQISHRYTAILNALKLCTLLLLVVTSLGFVFDGRYRSFPTAVFLIPSLLCLIWNDPKASSWKLLLQALFVSSLITLWNETFYNLQAIGWIVVCLIPTLRILRPRDFFKKPPFVLCLGSVVVIFASLLIRKQLMESASLVEICAIQTHFLCEIRDEIGYFIYLQFFGRVSLILACISLALSKKSMADLAFALSFSGLILYNFDIAALALALSLVSLSIHQSKGRQDILSGVIINENNS